MLVYLSQDEETGVSVRICSYNTVYLHSKRFNKIQTSAYSVSCTCMMYE